MTATTPQPSAGGGGAITCEYRELHGANVYSAESVLVGRIVSDGADGPAWTLEQPSTPLDLCAELLDALGLSGAEVRTREQWPLGSLVQTIAGQLVRRVNLSPAGAPAPAAPADPERELVLSLDPAAPVRESCVLAVRLLSACVSPTDPTGQDQDRLRALLGEFDKQHPALLPRATALVAACRKRDIPWCRIPGWADYMQLGEGALQARTDRIGATSRTAIQLTSDKTASSSLLFRHGIPVAAHIGTTRPARAWPAAQQIGLPVVVKPRWSDMGTAVSVGLTTKADVEAAFHRARKAGPWVLIERLIPGEDHRILVAGGRFIAAVQRLPAGVVGDGESTIERLLVRANADPRRASGKTTPLNPILYDEDAERMLRDHGWTLESVPPAGARVRLKSAANWAAGGTLRDVTDIIHADNVEMCVRAIVLCGVDVGGADFLTTDITRSFREVGGALCEVNILPSLEVHLFAEGAGNRDLLGDMLDALYPDVPRWRLPTVVVCGGDADAVGRAVGAALETRWRVGYAGPSQTTAGGWVVAGEGQRVHEAHRLLIEDPSTEAVVVAMTPDQVLAEGVGVSRADVVALVDRQPPASDVQDVLARTGAEVLRTRDAAVVAELLSRSCPR
jgi:D-alanine-D-alanine ligase-like ATP-grasp enzyme